MNFKFLIDNYKISIISLLFLTSCIEDQSFILDPNNGESFQFKTFELSNDNSYSFNDQNFKSGESSKLYLGDLITSNDVNVIPTTLYTYIRIDNELFNTNQFCNEENIISFNSIDLILPVTSFQGLGELDSYANTSYATTLEAQCVGTESWDGTEENCLSDDYYLSSNTNEEQYQNLENITSHYIKAYILDENDVNILDEDFESNSITQSVDVSNSDNIAPVVIDKLTDNLRINLNDYIYSNYNTETNDSSVDCREFTYEECTSIDNSENNNSCYWDTTEINYDFSSDIAAQYTSGYHCYNKFTISNVICDQLEDLNLILEYDNPNSEVNQIIELYSSDNETITFNPYIDIDYDLEGTMTEYIDKYTFSEISSPEGDNEFPPLDDDEFLYNIDNGIILGFDQSITSLYNSNDIECICDVDGDSINDDCGVDGLCQGDEGYPENCSNYNDKDECENNGCFYISDNCQSADYGESDGISNDGCEYIDSSNYICTINNDSFSIEPNTLIPADWRGELFQIDVALNQNYMESFEDIFFYFTDIYFIYKDLDPSLDNDTTEGDYMWNHNDCGTDNDCSIVDSNNSQENDIIDDGEQYELFDDYGIDDCPDIYEKGDDEECGNEDDNLYNILGTEGNEKWDHSGDKAGYDGICQIDECEYFEDYGYDQVEDSYESGCFDTSNLFGNKLENITNSALTPSYSDLIQTCNLDVESIEKVICDGYEICGQLHWNIEGCTTCSELDPNGDNFNLDPSNDNWVDCEIVDEVKTCENDEDWDSETMGDGKWNEGEKFEKNNQWDWIDCDIVNDIRICEIDENWNSQSMGNGTLDLCLNYFDDQNCDKYEFFYDIGIDGIPDAYENYNDENYNDNWNDNNTQGTEGNGMRDDNEPFFDYGLDQIQTSEESGFNEGEENNKEYDEINGYNEYFNDYGLDQCENYQEGLDGVCDESNNAIDDPHDDNYNIDPNNDNWQDCGKDNDCENYDDDGSQGNGIYDVGERTENNNWRDEGEKFYDYGYDHTENSEEENYYANVANYIVSSGNSYKINFDEQSISFDEPTLGSNKQVGLWISSIEEIDNGYRLYVNIHTLIDLVAFQFKINHVQHQQQVEFVSNKSLYLFDTYYIENGIYNSYNQSSEKYILDATIYDTDLICTNSIKYFCTDYDDLEEYDSISSCEENKCSSVCVQACSDDFNLMYGYGIKSSFDFVSEDITLDEFLDEHSHANVSYEHTNLILYFNRNDEEVLFNQEETLQLNLEYFDDDNNEYVIYSNIGSKTISIDQDSLKINISPLIQDYMNNNIDYSNIIISTSDDNYIFSNLSIIYDQENSINNPRLEIFYSE